MTRRALRAAQPFGLDAHDPAFWQGGLSVIERFIGELEAIEEKG